MAKINYKLLIKKKIIRFVEPSKNLKESYLEMSNKFFSSADLLLKNNFFESATVDFYYSSYNSLTALLFYSGIKCENHNASIDILKTFFKEKELFEIISEIKEERIDKQYYHETPSTKERLNEIRTLCQKFNLGIKILISELNKDKIEQIKKELK